MAIIIPVFKNGSFKLAKKIFKDEAAFQKFKNAKEYLNYRKFAVMPKSMRTEALEKTKDLKLSESLVKALKKTDKVEPYNIAKGAIEFGNIVGSVLGLAIFAPQVSHLVVHPVLKAIGMEEQEKEHDD